MRRPRLRAVETIVVPDPRHGRVLVLRDTQGVADGYAVVPPALIPVVARMTGAYTTSEIAALASRETGVTVPVAVVDRLASELDAAFMLEGQTFDTRLAEVRRAFAVSSVREASHAGGAYPGERGELVRYIERECTPADVASPAAAEMLGLVAPHIDPWRGKRGYGRAYAALAKALPERAETFVLLGTSHAPMRQPFALTRKAFETPLGALAPDEDAILALEKAARFDAYADELNHKREHSIEFQAVFLKHAVGERPARIVPILAGLGEHQARGKDPRESPVVARFVDALAELVGKDPGKVVLIAGADMAHVGPRFGDPAPLDDGGREALEARDKASLALATGRESPAFWEHVAADLETRRVCGLAPIWTLLEALPETRRASLLHYEQTIDAEDGSIVSHAALGFMA